MSEFIGRAFFLQRVVTSGSDGSGQYTKITSTDADYGTNENDRDRTHLSLTDQIDT